MIYVQPYYFWKGHYKIYTNSLFKSKKDFLICASKIKYKRSGVYLLNPVFQDYNKKIIFFILSRILNYLNCILELYKRRHTLFKKQIHFLEFEPFSFFLFLILNIFLRKKFIITIHSTNLSSNSNNLLFIIQRIFFYIIIFLLNFYRCKIVVHKARDKKNLEKFFYKGIHVIEYPSPKIQQIKKKFKGDKSLLIFGQIRKDKNMKYSVTKAINDNFSITVAGKIIDEKGFWYSLKKERKIKLIDNYISNKYLKNLIKKNDFIFLPYGSKYSGSAGPLKDSMSFAQPVICSDIEYFKIFINKNNVGYLQNKSLKKNIRELKINEYYKLQKNCLDFARKNNFNNFLSKHKNIYKYI